MRPLYALLDRLEGDKKVVSLHYKQFPIKPYYLTIHTMDGECHMYEGQSINELEERVMVDWSETPRPAMPLPAGFPRPC